MSGLGMAAAPWTRDQILVPLARQRASAGFKVEEGKSKD